MTWGVGHARSCPLLGQANQQLAQLERLRLAQIERIIKGLLHFQHDRSGSFRPHDPFATGELIDSALTHEDSRVETATHNLVLEDEQLRGAEVVSSPSRTRNRSPLIGPFRQK